MNALLNWLSESLFPKFQKKPRVPSLPSRRSNSGLVTPRQKYREDNQVSLKQVEDRKKPRTRPLQSDSMFPAAQSLKSEIDSQFPTRPLSFGLVGFHERGFVISRPAEPQNQILRRRFADLREKIKMTSTRNISEGLQFGLDLLEQAPSGRRGIIVITSGPTSDEAKFRELRKMAIMRQIGIHIVLIGSNPNAEGRLNELTTREPLRYGSFHVVNTAGELEESFLNELSGYCPKPYMRGRNTVILLTDCSHWMVESFAMKTRLEMLIGTIPNCFDRFQLRQTAT